MEARIVLLIILTLNMPQLVESTRAEMDMSRFIKVLITSSITPSEQTSGVMCAHHCIQFETEGYSYSSLLHSCQCGSCSLTNFTRDSRDVDMYITCRPDQGFKLLSLDLVRVCVWVSNDTANFTTARDDCKERESHLYTVKTIEKLQILQENFDSRLWVGLNDIDNEGVYRWEDDGSIIDSNLVYDIFATGEPNNFGNEDCVNYYWNGPKLNDVECWGHQHYICEKQCFYFP